MRITRSLAAFVAAASLGGGALALVAPSSAYAVAPPAGSTSLAGTATAAGTPTAGIEVDLYQVAANGASAFLGTTDTAPDGTYYFNFTDGSTNSSGAGSISAPTAGTQLKLGFSDDRVLTADQLTLQDVFYSGQPTLQRATPIAQPAPGAVTTVATVSVPYQAGIRGTVTVPVPAGYTYTGFAVAYDADEQEAAEAVFDNDPATTDGLTTYLLDVDPSQSYTVRYFAAATPTTPGAGPDITYVSQFYKTGSTFDDATPVAVGAAGSITQPIDVTLTNALTAAEAPAIVGQVAPGKTLSVDPGTWSIKTNNVYTYQWLANGAVVSTTPTYTVAKGDLGKKLQVVVTTRVGDYIGSAATPVEKVKYASRLKAAAKAVYVNGKRVVQVTGVLKVSGVTKKKLAKALKGVRVTVYDVSKTDDTVLVRAGRAKVKNGKVVVTVKGLISGKHFLAVDLTGPRVAEVVKILTVKV